MGVALGGGDVAAGVVGDLGHSHAGRLREVRVVGGVGAQVHFESVACAVTVAVAEEGVGGFGGLVRVVQTVGIGVDQGRVAEETVNLVEVAQGVVIAIVILRVDVGVVEERVQRVGSDAQFVFVEVGKAVVVEVAGSRAADPVAEGVALEVGQVVWVSPLVFPGVGNAVTIRVVHDRLERDDDHDRAAAEMGEYLGMRTGGRDLPHVHGVTAAAGGDISPLQHRARVATGVVRSAGKGGGVVHGVHHHESVARRHGVVDGERDIGAGGLGFRGGDRADAVYVVQRDPAPGAVAGGGGGVAGNDEVAGGRRTEHYVGGGELGGSALAGLLRRQRRAVVGHGPVAVALAADHDHERVRAGDVDGGGGKHRNASSAARV
ncbi:MAG: hypothetical protein H7A50_09440 [Akkermansiaceae bacterium]|nr:hypothetical protein [Akkermansiaceae bacterium]